MLELDRPVALAIDVVAWTGITVGAGYLLHRLPDRMLEDDAWLFRQRGWEQGGRFYTGVLRIKRWKRFLPEAGDAFKGGFNKAALGSLDDSHLRAHVREARRAESVHWAVVVAGPVFMLFNRWYDVVAMQVLAIALSVPCIAAQRYNRIRLQRVLAGRVRRSLQPS